MKAQVYSEKGEKKNEVTLPVVFSTVIREDIAQKYFEVEKFSLRQSYATDPRAGRRHSASGTISHRRHKWKGAYGKGISRVPRKKMWRRGTQFYWVGAEVSSARGGRTINAPQGLYTPRKMNRKEKVLAINSGIAATANKDYVTKRYSTIKNATTAQVIETLPAKTKSLLAVLKTIFGENFEKTFKIRQVRAGKGKKRGRKYKSNAGLLIVTGKDEKAKYSGVDVKKVNEIRMRDVYPLGRLALYTEKALEELK